MITWEKTALLFPGQGSQVVGMGAEFAATYPQVQALFAEADSILETPFSQLCFTGPEADLNDTYNTQTALYIVGIAAFTALNLELKNRGLPPVHPAFMAGHSLGEFTALVAGGAMTFADGLRLVRRRAWLMKQAGEKMPGGMAAILGLEVPVVEEICIEATAAIGKPVVLANDNCPGQIVISGDKDAIEHAIPLAKERGAKRAIPVNISVAAHSPLMEDAAEEFRQAVESTPITAPQIPVVGNALASVLTDVPTIRHELNTQLASRLRWTEGIQLMIAHGTHFFIELGPKGVLTGLLKRIDRDVSGISIEKPADLTSLFATD